MHGHAIWVSRATNTPLNVHPLLKLQTNKPIDPDVWTDPEVFRPERWFEQPDAPIFTYGLGYRMCAGSLLANRELYLTFMRMLNSFEILLVTQVDTHPV